MRHDIITATLPVDPAERLALEDAEAFLRSQDAHRQDTAMLKRDDPKPAAPSKAAEDPLAQVRDAIITALTAASIEGSDRDNELRLGYILDEVKRAIYRMTLAHTLLSPPLAAGQIHSVDPAQFEERNGLLVEHKPGARVKGGAL